jgi:hypothetical protein
MEVFLVGESIVTQPNERPGDFVYGRVNVSCALRFDHNRRGKAMIESGVAFTGSAQRAMRRKNVSSRRPTAV